MKDLTYSKLELAGAVPKSLNELFAMSHWARRRYKEDVSNLIFYEAKLQKPGPALGKCKIKFELYFSKNRKRDYDNFLGGLKFWIDGLRYAKLITEDNSEVLTGLSVEFYQSEKESTIIKIFDEPE